MKELYLNYHVFCCLPFVGAAVVIPDMMGH